MFGKVLESGLTEIIPLICTSAVWDQYPMFSHPVFSQGSFLGEWLQSAGCQLADIVFGPEFPQSSYVHLGGLQSLMTVTAFVYWDGRKHCISQTYNLNMQFAVVFVQLPSCVWLFSNCVDCSMPGSLILQYLLEFARTHVHWVSDAIQPSYLLRLLLLLPSIFPSIRVFSNKSTFHIRGPKY